MPSSHASSSSSSSVIIISDTDSDDNAAFSRPVVDRIASSLTTQGEVDALCKKHGVPSVYTTLPAGDMRACTPPPPRAVCVYAHALEAGMRVPLHGFFSDVLVHFRLAPGQLAPSGWRVLLGFFVLCRDAGVQPSVPVFSHFFSLAGFKIKGWHCFRPKDAAGALFTGLPKTNKGWKGKFFFLVSPKAEPWPCPVRWSQPPSKIADPVLTSQQKKTADKILAAHGATAVDLRTYLSQTNLAAAFSFHSTSAQGVDSFAKKVKPEPDGDTPSLSAKKRKYEEAANAKDALGGRSGQSTPQADHGCSASASGLRGSDSQAGPLPVPNSHDGDSTDWETARKFLENIIPPSRQREFAVAAILQAAKTATCSSGYMLELEEKLLARDAEAADLRGQLEKSKAELAASKAEVESAKTAAVQQFLGSQEYTRRVAEQALAAYERGAEDMKRAALRLNPSLDTARLVVLPD